MTILRAAMTQTINAYADMPSTVADLPLLANRLEDIRKANVDHHLQLIEEAAHNGVQAICLGELFAAPYFALGREMFWRNLAEDSSSGPTVTALAAAAQRLNIVIVAPIYELDSATGKRYNTAVIIDADGSILGKYRKTHIPVGGNEQGSFDERFYYGPSEIPQNPPSVKILGDNPYFPVFDTQAGRLGVAICYDRHFEGVVRSLAHAGAQLIFTPAVTFGQKSERMWEIEFAVDAARHQVFIGGSNRLGCECPWNQMYFGSSHFVGPNGRMIELSKNSQLIIADLDLDSLSLPDPSGWNLARDTRPDIYG
jgi:beta-ureidopropionase